MRKFVFEMTLAFGLLVFMLGGASFASGPFTDMGVIKPKVRMNAPAFNLKTVAGGHTALSDFKGKVILLNFWATWCPDCREEMPSLQKLWKQFKAKGIVVIAVAVDRSQGEVESFVRKLGLTFPVLLDTDGDVRRNYEIAALPTTYIIGRDGRISGKIYGGREWAGKDADALMEHLLRP